MFKYYYSVTRLFLENIAVGTEDECWFWCGPKDKKGYGRLSRGRDENRVVLPAHRLSYEYFVGPIPVGLVIDHLCNNPSCVNPKHLHPKTIYENASRGGFGKQNYGNTLLKNGICRNNLHTISSEEDLVSYPYKGRVQNKCKQCEKARKYTKKVLRRELSQEDREKLNKWYREYYKKNRDIKPCFSKRANPKNPREVED